MKPLHHGQRVQALIEGVWVQVTYEGICELGGHYVRLVTGQMAVADEVKP